VDKVSSHRVEKVRILVNNILVIEKEFVRLQQLLLLHHQLVGVFVIFHDLVVFHVVVRNCLAAKHYQGVLIYHVEANEPDSAVDDGVKHDPGVPFDVQLLD
jgi:hypothetical protein